MSVKISVIHDGVTEVEVFTPPTLKEMCLLKCFSNKDILTKEVDEVEAGPGPKSSNLSSWEKYRLKETLNGVLVEDLLDLGDKFMFMLTPRYVPVLAAIRMSQPENLVKVHVTNTRTLQDDELEWLMSGGDVKSLDIHGCQALQKGSLETINKFGGKLEYLRIGNSSQVLPQAWENPSSPILRTPRLKTFIVGGIKQGHVEVETLDKYWKFLLHDFIANLENLQIIDSDLLNLEFLLRAKDTLSSLTLHSCFRQHGQFRFVLDHQPRVWSAESPIFKLKNLQFLDINYNRSDWDSGTHLERIISELPNLTALNISLPPRGTHGVGALEISSDSSGRRLLEFLGTMDDEAELRDAKRFAIKVAGFGSFEGEFCALDFYASRSYSCMKDSLNTLVGEWAHPHSTVTVINLLLKTLTKNGFFDYMPNSGLWLLNNLVTQEVAAKLGSYMVNQCTDCIEAELMNMTDFDDSDDSDDTTDLDVFIGATVLMIKLEAELGSYHCVTILVPALETAIRKLEPSSSMPRPLKVFTRNVAQLFRTAVDRFPETFATPSEIQSICSLIRTLWNYTFLNKGSLNSFCSMISSLETLCLTCAPFKTMFQAADGKGMISDLLDTVEWDWPGASPSVTAPLLRILQTLRDSDDQDNDIRTGVTFLLI